MNHLFLVMKDPSYLLLKSRREDCAESQVTSTEELWKATRPFLWHKLRKCGHIRFLCLRRDDVGLAFFNEQWTIQT